MFEKKLKQTGSKTEEMHLSKECLNYLSIKITAESPPLFTGGLTAFLRIKSACKGLSSGEEKVRRRQRIKRFS